MNGAIVSKILEEDVVGGSVGSGIMCEYIQCS